jgi:hypothetical protein
VIFFDLSSDLGRLGRVEGKEGGWEVESGHTYHGLVRGERGAKIVLNNQLGLKVNFREKLGENFCENQRFSFLRKFARKIYAIVAKLFAKRKNFAKILNFLENFCCRTNFAKKRDFCKNQKLWRNFVGFAKIFVFAKFFAKHVQNFRKN